MEQLSTYRTKVVNEVGDTSSRAQNVVDNGIKAVYQEILGYIAKYLIGTSEEDVVASISNRYITPVNTYSEFKKVLYHSATDTSFYPLTLMDEEDYFNHYVNSDAGNPRQYYIKGNLVYFDLIPTDAGTVKISGIKVQPELTGAEVSVLPDRFTYVLVAGAIAWFKAYEMLPDADSYQKIYKGSFWGQGRIDGLLGKIIQELSVKQPIKRPKFWGRN